MIDWNKLKEPFPEKDIEWRIMRSGKNAKGIWAMCLAYITNRAIMDRLDDIVGPENWRNEFIPAPNGGVLCGISIFYANRGEYGVWITKWDGAENTDIEAIKGGLSGAMKRAAVQWGMGRYLYNLEEGFATITDSGRFRATTKEKEAFKWNPPALPEWALPKGSKGNTKPEPDKEPPKKDKAKPDSDIKTELKEALHKLCSGDPETMNRILKEESLYKGKFIDGSEGIKKASDGWCKTTLGKVKKRLEGGEPPEDWGKDLREQEAKDNEDVLS